MVTRTLVNEFCNKSCFLQEQHLFLFFFFFLERMSWLLWGRLVLWLMVCSGEVSQSGLGGAPRVSAAGAGGLDGWGTGYLSGLHSTLTLD